ncbi:MAG: SRPBCC family protein [Gallionellaceae bacterium]|nr:SRPBCC family protein [Gallionellaceae bacterium]
MSNSNFEAPDPKLDLSFERIVDLPKELIWKAWTQPEHLKPWFCPLPWKTIDCEIDLRPGGIFRTVMQSPEGKEFPNLGCYLEVIANEKLIWTNALLPGFRPAPVKIAEETGAFFFTASIQLAAHGTGTRYTATVRHGDEASCQKHAAMGYKEGWGKALEQLVAYAKVEMRIADY